VVQVLSKAAEILGLVPVFPVRNTTTFGSGAAHSNAVFRDCVLVKKNTTVAEVGKKIMGDAPIAYIEGPGGIRVADDQIVSKGKNDVSDLFDHRWTLLIVLR
jgi:ribosome-binding ATPase YchF (GTP1/OBG family)